MKRNPIAGILSAAGLAALTLLVVAEGPSVAQEVRDHRKNPAPQPTIRDHRTPHVQVATFDCELFRQRYRRDKSGSNHNFVSSAWAALGRAELVGNFHCALPTLETRDCNLTKVVPQRYRRSPVKFMFNVRGDCAQFKFRNAAAIARQGPGYATYEVEMRRNGDIRWELALIAGPGRGGGIYNRLPVRFIEPPVTAGW
jgi:hypothetical protein